MVFFVFFRSVTPLVALTEFNLTSIACLFVAMAQPPTMLVTGRFLVPRFFGELSFFVYTAATPPSRY